MPLIKRSDPDLDHLTSQPMQKGRRRRPNAVTRPSLSARLAMVCDLLPDGRRLIDIGTDHAYLPVAAVIDGRFPMAIAADIRPGPIATAEWNIRRYGCSERVQAILSDGLAAFSVQAGDVIVMAGLGGLEMIDILHAAPAVWPLIILQPQKSAPALRQYLAANGYAIRKEVLCLDDHRLYLALVAEQAPAEVSDDLADHYIGPALRRDRPVLFHDYLEKQRIQVMHAVKRGEPLTAVLARIDDLMKTTRNERGEKQ